jgi:hypothetical protein
MVQKADRCPQIHLGHGGAKNRAHFFEDGQLNLTANCLDRHVKTSLRDKVAIIWQGDAEEEVKKLPMVNCTPTCANAPMS